MLVLLSALFGGACFFYINEDEKKKNYAAEARASQSMEADNDPESRIFFLDGRALSIENSAGRRMANQMAHLNGPVYTSDNRAHH
jgi:hypothetical protein